jgi:PHD/YefM family antitoxin component YafN of YafNO toxin-antitoxin module
MKSNYFVVTFVGRLKIYGDVDAETILADIPDFLGPNHQTVLNFWTYLSHQNYRSIEEVYYDDHENFQSIAELRKRIQKITPPQTDWAVWGLNGMLIPAATYELIAMHEILEEGNRLIFLPQIEEKLRNE